MNSHDAPPTGRKPNRLANETSPYLRQHQYNPVNWHPWGEEAIAKARAEDKPLLVSIGYSACHWCHVMEQESFENEDLARFINETVIPVKVDREERPDVDAIYMDACVALTGQGGWPLNAFVTPDLKPFFVGTYFPPDSRWGRPGFRQVLERIREAWLTDREGLRLQASNLHGELVRIARSIPRGSLDPGVLEKLVDESANQFDMYYGGFGGAPKFPPDHRMAALLAAWNDTGAPAALEMVNNTLLRMAAGGIYDHLGGGFARYSVDAQWLVPHFEKMLYNQALLLPVFLDAFLITGHQEFAETARETLDWVLRECTSPEGPFWSAYDADSEGVEGKFYVWTPEEVAAVLGESDAESFCDYYGVTRDGNFEHGTSIIHASMPLKEFANRLGTPAEELAARFRDMKARLRTAREQRVMPGLDDKCLTSWNGLMIGALARGATVLGDKQYADAARRAADFILDRMRPGPGRLLRNWCRGEATIEGMLEDYACLAAGLLNLYEATFDWRYAAVAGELCDTMIEKFADPEDGAFYFTAAGDPSLITRTREFHDGAMPSAPALAVLVLLRAAALLCRPDFKVQAVKSFVVSAALVNRSPQAFATMTLAWRFATGPSPEIVIAGDPACDAFKMLAAAAHAEYSPCRVIVAVPPAGDPAATLPIFAGKSAQAGSAQAYVCVDYTCQQPVQSPDALQEAIRAASTPKP